MSSDEANNTSETLTGNVAFPANTQTHTYFHTILLEPCPHSAFLCKACSEQGQKALDDRSDEYHEFRQTKCLHNSKGLCFDCVRETYGSDLYRMENMQGSNSRVARASSDPPYSSLEKTLDDSTLVNTTYTDSCLATTASPASVLFQNQPIPDQTLTEEVSQHPNTLNQDLQAPASRESSGLSVISTPTPPSSPVRHRSTPEHDGGIAAMATKPPSSVVSDDEYSPSASASASPSAAMSTSSEASESSSLAADEELTKQSWLKEVKKHRARRKKYVKAGILKADKRRTVAADDPRRGKWEVTKRVRPDGTKGRKRRKITASE